MENKYLLPLLLLIFGQTIFGQNAADRDSYFSFNANNSLHNTYNELYSVNIQSNGKILIGGYSGSTSSQWKKYLVRLNFDGTKDNTLIVPDMIGKVYTIVVQPDQKIILGTSHTNGVSGNQKDIIRLNSDGSIDQNFQNNLNYLTGNGGYRGVAIQQDGKILVAGSFTTVDNVSIKGLIRLQSNGLRDTNFNLQGTSFNGLYTTYKVFPLKNGKILVSGNFTSYNGISANGLLRLNSNGSLDTTFNIGTGFYNSAVSTIAIQTDNKILVGGGFTSFNGDNSKKYLIRLNEDGNIDNNFVCNFDSSVETVEIQNDDKILVGGYFKNVNGSSKNYFVRLNSNGTTDNTFSIGTGFSSVTRMIKMQNDGQILVVGAFNSYQDVATDHMIRLLGGSFLSTTDFFKNNFEIYPNPVQNTLNFSNSDLNDSEYEIFDLLGKKVGFGMIDNNQIDVSNLLKGIYLIKSKTENGVLTKKFIKE